MGIEMESDIAKVESTAMLLCGIDNEEFKDERYVVLKIRTDQGEPVFAFSAEEFMKLCELSNQIVDDIEKSI